MRRSSLKVSLAAAVMAIGLQGAAHAVIIGPGPAPGSDNNEFEFTSEAKSTVSGSYSSKKEKFKGGLSSNFIDSGGVLDDPLDEALVCVLGRKVEVFKNRAKKADLLIGTDKVDADLKWAVPADVSKGTYYAKVTEDEYLVRTYYGVNEYVVCLADQSPEIKP